MALLKSSITLADISDGAPGQDGASIEWLGSLNTAPSNPRKNQAYYNLVDKKSYIYNDIEWVVMAQDGKDGSGGKDYQILINKEKVIKYKALKDKDYIVTFSPETLDFQVGEQGLDSFNILDKDSYMLNIVFNFLTSQTFFPIISTNSLNNLSEFLEYNELLQKWELRLQEIFNAYLEELPVHADIKDFGAGLNVEEGIINFVMFLNEQPLTWLGSYFSGNEDFQERLFNENDVYYDLDQKKYFKYKDSIWVEITDLRLFSIPVTWAIKDSLATFSTKADSIVAAIDESKLSFSRDGLNIYNNGIKISLEKEELVEDKETGEAVLEKTTETVFEIRTDSQGKNPYLYLNGTGYFNGGGVFSGNLSAAGGTFSGTLNAVDGEFTGSLTAASGTFNGQLVAAKGEIERLTIGDTETSYISLDSVNGIQHFQTVFEYTNENNLEEKIAKVISSFEINVKTGLIRADAIQLSEGTIGNLSFKDSQIYANSGAWSINENTATFNNIVASGRFSSAVFEHQQLQLCGGTFVFKDAYIFEDVLSTNLSSEGFKPNIKYGSDANSNKELLKENNLYLITNTNRSLRFFAKYQKKSEIEDDWYLIPYNDVPKLAQVSYNLIIDLGSIYNATNPKDWVIGINSTASNSLENGLASNSITFSSVEFDESLKTYKFMPKIILGKIPANTFLDGNNETYGLFAESAYLTGTLTTKYKESSGIGYAGVNTLSTVQFNKQNKFTGLNIEADSSNIIFWAGASGVDGKFIQDAKFQVTSNGSLYAQQGYFEGSILTKATIEAATLKASSIIGSEDNSAPLKIYDSDKGIEFYDTNGEDLIMAINSNKLLLSSSISFENYIKNDFAILNASLYGDKIALTSRETNTSILIDAQKMNFYNQFLDEKNSYGDSESIYNLCLKNKNNRSYLAINKYNTELYSFSDNFLEIKPEIKIFDNFIFSDNEERTVAEYKRSFLNGSCNGLDLYILEVK